MRAIARAVVTAVTAAALVSGFAARATAEPVTDSATGTDAVSSREAGPGATAETDTTDPDSADPTVREQCPDPEPGYVTCFALVRTDITGHLGLVDDPAGYGAGDLADAYNLPTDRGEGMTIAVIDAFDNPNAEADQSVYRAQFGLPACTTATGCFRKVDQRGGTDYPVADPDWAGEIAVDIEMAAAACPRCHILLVESDDASVPNMAAAVDTAVELGADVVSNSYGTDDGDESLLAYDHHYDHPGVAVTVASGDDGFEPKWPASNPRVTAVGGTELVPADNERGWAETVYARAGSGCSTMEPKPAFQHDPGCGNRMVADVAAVASPATGVAVYHSYLAPGWQVYGGTSAAAPIVAGAYALAGKPAASDYPNRFGYDTPGGLNDVTSGRNGGCAGSYLCTGVEGYDGPTGLGTPNGVSAFAPVADHGVLAGTVTDAVTGSPIAGARVTAADRVAVTGSDGTYAVSTPHGVHDVTVTTFGYLPHTTTQVTIEPGQTTTINAVLDPAPLDVITGTVTDGSGHGWPLHARITVEGQPAEPVFSDPFTGRYELAVPTDHDYTLRVSPDIPGYQIAEVPVTATGHDVNRDIGVPVDPHACSVPGYEVNIDGITEPFESGAVPEGWTVRDNAGSGHVWEFDSDRLNITGGEGGFAIAISQWDNGPVVEDTELVTPPLDMSDMSAPSILFKTLYQASGLESTADVDYSVDGGTTWTNVWHQDTETVVEGDEDIALPEAAGRPDVRVRFHYVGDTALYWEIDDVVLGQRTCDPTHGGLVTGHVTDANTGDALNRARVTGSGVTGSTGSTTSEDPAMGGGYYWAFTPDTEDQAFDITRTGYQSASATIDVATNGTTRLDVALAAGHLVVADSVDLSTELGTDTSGALTFTNDGTAAVDVSLRESDGGFGTLTQAGAPPRRVSGDFSPTRELATTPAPELADAVPYAAPWRSIANYPTTIMDNTLATGPDGTVYSFGGTVRGLGAVDTAYSYDPDTNRWTPIATMPHARQQAAAAVFDGKVYLTGGWGWDGLPDPHTDIYDPATNTWSAGARAPGSAGAPGSAQVGDKLYLFGGCGTFDCGLTASYVYDISADIWATINDYPEPVAWQSCGAIAGQVYCAGGATKDTEIARTYSYDPITDDWSPRADLPGDMWASGHTTANGTLILSGGVVDHSHAVTNEGYAYDPVADSWSPIPNSNTVLYRGGSSCGMYKVGGSRLAVFSTANQAERLPGFDVCDGSDDVSWLGTDPTEFTVNPGQTITVTVSGGASGLDQPGEYTGRLWVLTNSPYQLGPVSVTMDVTPPPTWAQITGTVTGVTCDGVSRPLAGATVQVDGWTFSQTLSTDERGRYRLWLDARNGPVTLIAAKDFWQPAMAMVTLTAGARTTRDFPLKIGSSCG